LFIEVPGAVNPNIIDPSNEFCAIYSIPIVILDLGNLRSGG